MSCVLSHSRKINIHKRKYLKTFLPASKGTKRGMGHPYVLRDSCNIKRGKAWHLHALRKEKQDFTFLIRYFIVFLKSA